MDTNKDYKDIEKAVLQYLQENISPTVFEIWFKTLQIENLDLNENTAVFSIDSDFKRDFIIKRYLPTVEKALSNVLGFTGVTICLESREKRDGFHPTEVSEPIEEPVKKPELFPDDTDPIPIDTERAIEDSSIVDKYTFANFIEGESNRFALAACKAVAMYSSNPNENEMDLSTYNPLFIYGPSGVGKTHLLFAVTNEIKLNNPRCKIVYKKGEDFTNELISSLQKRTQEQFRNRYRNADILLIDDVQFIAGKESTQEEFFHTFSALYESGKQIILTSDRPPKDIKTLEDRLMSRFIWGLLADIQPPSFELRTAIINKKAEKLGVTIPGDVVEYLATKLQNNIRQIEGSIKKISAISLLTGAPITIELCRRAISDVISGSEPVNITINRIMEAVSKTWGIPVSDIRAKKRTANVVNARHICIYLIRQLTDVSFNMLGEIFEKDHATIMSGYRKIEAEMAEDSDFAAKINNLKEELKI